MTYVPKSQYKLTNPTKVNQAIICSHWNPFPCVRIKGVRVPGSVDIIFCSHRMKDDHIPFSMVILLPKLVVITFIQFFRLSLSRALTTIWHVRRLISGKRNNPLITPHPAPMTNFFELIASRKNCCRNYKPDCHSK